MRRQAWVVTAGLVLSTVALTSGVSAEPLGPSDGCAAVNAVGAVATNSPQPSFEIQVGGHGGNELQFEPGETITFSYAVTPVSQFEEALMWVGDADGLFNASAVAHTNEFGTRLQYTTDGTETGLLVNIFAAFEADAVGILSCTIAGTVPPPTPTNVVAAAEQSGIAVSWTPPPTGDGRPIVGYTAVASPGGESCSTAGAVRCVVSGLTPGGAYRFTVYARDSTGPGLLSALSATVTWGSPYGEFTPLTPTRILDTRTGNGRGGVVGPLGENRSFGVQVTGRGGVDPSGVSAVVMNVTVTEPTAPSYLTVWPADEDLPTVSNLNYVAGQTVPNLVTVAVGENGRVQAFNRFGSTHVIFDVIGFYADDTGPAGSRFHAVDPYRYFDTRIGRGGVDVGPRGPSSVLRFNPLGKGGVPPSDVSSVVMNVTVTEPTMPSFLTVYPDDVKAPPLASNLNFLPGQTVPNLVAVRVPASGVIDFYNLQGSVHVIADVVGYYDNDTSTEAGRFLSVVPYRPFDSRNPGNSAWGPDDWSGIGDFPGFGGIRLGEVESVVLNVTVTEPTAPSYLTVFPSDLCEVPLASNLNYVAGQTVPNQVVVRLGADRGCIEPDWLETISLYNRFGSVHVVIDVFGAFTATTTTLFD